MKRRKPVKTVPMTVRIDETLARQLEELAKADRVTLSDKVRVLLEEGLEPKPELSLADFRADWLRRLREVLEHGAREDPESIETVWRVIQLVESKFNGFNGETEIDLSSYVKNPRIRELLRGAVAPITPEEE